MAFVFVAVAANNLVELPSPFLGNLHRAGYDQTTLIIPPLNQSHELG